MLVWLVQGWAYGGSLLGMYLYGRKSLWGPTLSVLGFIPWTYLAVISHLWPMVVFDAIVSSISLNTLLQWRKQKATP